MRPIDRNQSISHLELAAQLRSLEQELVNQGCHSKDSRLPALAALLEQGMPGDHQRGFITELGHGSYLDGAHRFRMLLAEAMEFRDTWVNTDWSRKLDVEEAGRWKKATEGALFVDKETPLQHGTYPRNTLFELSCLAHIRERGIDARSVADGDIMATIGDTVVRIECKRVFSEKKFAKNLNRAVKELNQAEVASDTPERKIVCMSIDPLFLADFSNLRVQRGESSERMLWPTEKAVDLYVRHAYQKFRTHIRSALKQEHFACVTVFAATTGEHEGELKRIKWAQCGTAPDAVSDQISKAFFGHEDEA